jgi:conjugative relaxase-like TrwC/TraI family protein
MLRINALKSASDYYTKSLTKGDFYSEQSEITGQWQGLGASRLGLFGEIQKEQFDQLCAGSHPLTGDQLTSRIVSDRREAYDFTFSVPKSVSLLSAVSSEEVTSLIQDQITKSVKFTMAEVEKNIQCRVRDQGKKENRVTGNLVYGYFLHKNSRPINGYSDPQLHVHAVVMNLTFDSVDKKWKAVELRDKLENREYYNSIFNSNLANRLQTIGLDIRKTPGDFDLAGITDQTIKTFSRRTDEIEKEAKVQNIHTADAKGKLGARTRQFKSDNHSQSELRGIYKGLLTSDQKVVLEGLNNELQNKIENNEIGYKLLDMNSLQEAPAQTKKWLDYTLEHHFERHSTSSEQRLIGEVLKNGIGQTSLEQVVNTIEQYKKEGVLIDELQNYSKELTNIEKQNGFTQNKTTIDLATLQARNNLSPAITTQVALSEEQNIITNINSRIRTFRPPNPDFAETILKDQFLNQNQKEVVSKILLSGDGVTLLEGKAGTGKTTTLKSLEQGLLAGDYTVTVLAPTTKAVEVLQSEGFDGAMTVNKYLQNETQLQINDQKLENEFGGNTAKDTTKTNSQKVIQNPSTGTNYLIIDEASLVSVRQMDKLLKLAKDNHQRVLLVGDTKQHKSVERGNSLKTIQEYSDIRTHSLFKIQRQTQSLAKEAVEQLSRGQTLEGLEKFQSLGFVQVIKDDQKRLDMVAQLYVQNLPVVYSNKILEQHFQVEKERVERIENGQKIQPKKNILNFMDKLLGKNKEVKPEHETQTKLTFHKIQYPKLTPQPTTLVITPTHSDGQLIHTSIRGQLKMIGLIDSQDHSITTLRSLGWTVAQKAEISNYQPGQILNFTFNKGEFKNGDRFEVIHRNIEKQENQIIEGNIDSQIRTHAVEDLNHSNIKVPQSSNQIQIQPNPYQIQNTKTGQIKEIPTSLHPYFDVFQTQQLTVSAKDLIQLGRQTIVQDKEGKDHKTTNGAIYQIKSISPKTGNITLTNDWVIPSDFGILKSAYYSTSQAAQGQTIQHSIFYTSQSSLPLLNQEMVYVANSRFKQSNMILTTDLQEFQKHAIKGEMKSPAIEIVLPLSLQQSQEYVPSFQPTKNQKLYIEKLRVFGVEPEIEM